MKSLNEHIVSKNFENKLLDVLHEHINAEFFINYNLYYPLMINEELGHFSNYDELIQYITYHGIFKNDRYKENTNYDITVDCEQFNTFFKKINLHVIADKYEYGAYLGTKNDIVEFEIHISSHLPDDDELQSLFIHELMHAYEDINRIKNGEPSLFDYFSDEYTRARDNIRSNVYEYNILGRCKYFLNDKEQRAYFGQLEHECEKLLDQYDIKHFDYTAFRNNLQKSGIWKIYFDYGTFVMKMKSMSEEDKKNLVDAYNKEWNKNVKFSELRKEFTGAWNKFYKKFNQLLPKIVCELLLRRRRPSSVYVGAKYLEKYDKYKD